MSGADHGLTRTRDLLAGARAGEREALERLFHRFRAPLRAFLHARLPSPARGLLETDDLVQEVFSRAWSALERFEDRGAGAFWAYLRQVGMNEVRQAIRKQQAAKRGVPEALGESSRAPSSGERPVIDGLIAKEDFEAFETALERISEQHRTALLMRFELDLDYSEIADECGFPSADAARVAIHRASATLAQELARGSGRS